MAIKKNYDRRKKIKHPKPSELLAEFVGMFLGDGSFTSKYQIAISWNHRCEEGYAGYIRKAIKDLFEVDSRIRIRKKYGSAEVIVDSSNLVDYLRKLTGIKAGESKKSFKLPAWLSKNKRYKIGFLRGLFDSEGCVYRHRYYSNGKAYSYVKIAVTNYCNRILSLFQHFLKSIEIDSVKYRNRIHIYNSVGVKRFFSLVGSNNNKNIKRFRELSR